VDEGELNKRGNHGISDGEVLMKEKKKRRNKSRFPESGGKRFALKRSKKTCTVKNRSTRVLSIKKTWAMQNGYRRDRNLNSQEGGRDELP